MQRSNTAEVKGIPSHNNNNGNTNNISVDALPKQFIASMKTLFDILDDKQTGFVRYSDIEKGWQDDGCKGLPRGVLDSLRKVTPANGLLSFERFCAGLKLCLLRNQSESGNVVTTNNSLNTPISNKSKLTRRSKSPRSPSAALQAIENTQHINNTKTATQWCNNSSNPTATVRPRNHVLTAQRTLSLPQLSPDSSELEAEMSTVNINNNINLYNSPPPPPKPPRAAAVAAAKNATLDKNGIRHALQNWQMGLLLNEMDASEKRELPIPSYINNRGSADGGSSSATDSALSATTFLTPTKKGGSCSLVKRREPRRHTLQNGIDYNMLRRLKQYEEEREVLLLGLDAIEKTRDWYLQQIESIQEKIRCLGRMGEHEDHWSEVQQERLNFQRTRVLEVNRNLATLADSWERGGIVPLHFNLAINSPTKSSNHLNRDGLYLPSNEHRRHKHSFSTNEIPSQQNLLFELRPTVPRRNPLRVSQSQSSPACSSSSVGGLIDADIVY